MSGTQYTRGLDVGTSLAGNLAGSWGLRLAKPWHADQRIRGGQSIRSSVSRGVDKHPKPDNRFSFLPAPLVKCQSKSFEWQSSLLRGPFFKKTLYPFSEAHSRLPRE